MNSLRTLSLMTISDILGKSMVWRRAIGSKSIDIIEAFSKIFPNFKENSIRFSGKLNKGNSGTL